MRKIFILFFGIMILGNIFGVKFVRAQEQIIPEFSISPAKKEISISPGETVVVDFTVFNNLGERTIFKIDIEDIAPGNDGEVVDILNGEDGPYSIRNYAFPSESEFALINGSKKNFQVTLSVPENISPGSLHGVVLVSSEPKDNGGTKTVSRLGSLLFVKVLGEKNEEGGLSSFDAGQNISFTNNDSTLQISFANNGNTYLNPYGIIEVKDLFGRTVQVIDVDPWFVLPNSVRIRDVVAGDLSIGRFSAVLSLNRGYGDIIDTAEVSFWILPWWIIIISIVVLIGILLGFYVLKFRRK